MGARRRIRYSLVGVASLVASALTANAAGTAPVTDLGAALPAWSALPFVGMLLSIALFPLLAPLFWYHHYPKVSAFWGIALALPFLLAFRGAALHAFLHVAIVDYLPFIILLGALFTIGGGICVRTTLRGSPAVNATLMAIGTVLASWVGTTGAAMLLIRPLLRANRGRRYRAHTVVFFIFLVANIGGSLTPLGDPPLFLGFLHGVPFFWTFSLWRETLLVALIVLGIYAVIDLVLWRREDAFVRQPSQAPREPLAIDGWHNIVFLAGVLVAVIVSGIWHPGSVEILGVTQGIQNVLRDAVLIGLAAASWLTTSRRVHEQNEYTWAPIQEVAILFAAIFATMIPALEMLRAGDRGALAFIVRAGQTPAQLFWATGGLSSFLDNAPTYLTFLSTALGRLYPGVAERGAIHTLIVEHSLFLRAIATGAVFMGANTYIGNAPNFMIKSIAENAGVRMPSFFGYMLRYSIPFLLPVFALATTVFFR